MSKGPGDKELIMNLWRNGLLPINNLNTYDRKRLTAEFLGIPENTPFS